MKFNYDRVADAAYLSVNKGKIAKTVEMGNSIIVDLGKKGRIVGIEILNFSFQLDTKKLKDAIKIRVVGSVPVTA